MALLQAFANKGQEAIQSGLSTTTPDYSTITWIIIISLFFGIVIGGTILIINLVDLINAKKEYYKVLKEKKELGE